MKKIMINILKKYLALFPEEKERQSRFIEYLNNNDDKSMIDWNNFNGHIVASGFIYAKEENKFLVLYHKDLKMYLYPGGHLDNDDINPLEAAKREIIEETGLTNFELLKLNEDKLIPIDIDTHLISFNERLNLPEHYHYDIRYLFIIDKKDEIKIDTEELRDYQWVDINELYNDPNYGKVTSKIEKLINEIKKV